MAKENTVRKIKTLAVMMVLSAQLIAPILAEARSSWS